VKRKKNWLKAKKGEKTKKKEKRNWGKREDWVGGAVHIVVKNRGGKDESRFGGKRGTKKRAKGGKKKGGREIRRRHAIV